MAKRITICAGIDTGKLKLDVALDGSSERTQVDNTPEGFVELLEWLKGHKVRRVGIEASGGYEQAVVADNPWGSIDNVRSVWLNGGGRNRRALGSGLQAC
ncbi:hypothetical protein ACVWZV_000952 [Bradyrhizobium sp. GM5.1]